MAWSREETLQSYLRDVEEVRIPQLRQGLAPLEEGRMHLAKRQPGGEWVDITAERIEQDRRSIKVYENIVKRLRAKLAQQS